LNFTISLTPFFFFPVAGQREQAVVDRVHRDQLGSARVPARGRRSHVTPYCLFVLSAFFFFHSDVMSGTIRRFLEKFGNGIDAVVFVLDDEVDVKAYDGTIPLYFPRNAVELEYSVRHLPDDVGNDLGEPVQSERKIRIGDIPRAQRMFLLFVCESLKFSLLPAVSTSNFLNQSNISEDNPMSSWADPSRESEMPELSADMTVCCFRRCCIEMFFFFSFPLDTH